MHIFTQLFLLALAGMLVVKFWLAWRHASHIVKYRGDVPAAFSGAVSLADHQKAADYTLAKLRVGSVDLVVGAAILLVWTLGGGLNALDAAWQTTAWTPLWQGVGFLLSYMIVSSIIDIPFDIYRTFVLEQRFGFNRMTAGLFIVDFFRQWALALALGVPLATLVLWLMQNPGPLWWFYVWAAWFGFALLMTWAFPRFIAPLFNKFSPLEDGELKDRIVQLLQKCGFHSEGVFVMDGSKRSAHGNAYFTGIGAHKRIVFFDTLLKTLDVDEVDAVLAHELGHFSLHHVRKRLIASAVMTLGALALLGWLYGQEWFFAGLGLDRATPQGALLLFMLVGPIFAFYAQPLMAYFSRKHEFEADAYACKYSDGKKLISALVKLYQENANTLTPDPLYSAMYDSHPPATIRVAHLMQHSHE